MLAPATLARVQPIRAAPRTQPVRFNKTYEVRWADLDANGHLRHSSYADYATCVRLAILADFGFPLQRFQEEKFGPVFFREETQFKREVHLGEKILVDFRVAAVSTCGRKWTLHHHVFKSTGKLAAIITIDGGWFDTETRRLRRPPPELWEVMGRIHHEWQTGLEGDAPAEQASDDGEDPQP